MTYQVDVTQKRQMKEFWVIRGISTKDGFYKCVAEREVDKPPTVLETADFLAENPEASFCSVAHNYKLL